MCTGAGRIEKCDRKRNLEIDDKFHQAEIFALGER